MSFFFYFPLISCAPALSINQSLIFIYQIYLSDLSIILCLQDFRLETLHKEYSFFSARHLFKLLSAFQFLQFQSFFQFPSWSFLFLSRCLSLSLSFFQFNFSPDEWTRYLKMYLLGSPELSAPASPCSPGTQDSE